MNCPELKGQIMILKEGVNLLNQRLDSLETKYGKLEIRVRRFKIAVNVSPSKFEPFLVVCISWWEHYNLIKTST